MGVRRQNDNAEGLKVQSNARDAGEESSGGAAPTPARGRGDGAIDPPINDT